MTKDASLTIRLPAELKDELKAMADRDGRSTSNLVERILRDWLKAQSKRSR